MGCFRGLWFWPYFSDQFVKTYIFGNSATNSVLFIFCLKLSKYHVLASCLIKGTSLKYWLGGFLLYKYLQLTSTSLFEVYRKVLLYMDDKENILQLIETLKKKKKGEKKSTQSKLTDSSFRDCRLRSLYLYL